MASEKITIYHNPRCSKSRQGKALLDERGIDYEIVEYLKQPLTAGEIKALLGKLGMSPREVMRKKEAAYKDLEIGTQDYSDDELVELIVQHPVLLERPIVVAGDRAVVGRPTERIGEIL